MEDIGEDAVWRRIRDAVSADRVFKFNIAHPSVDRTEYANRLLEDGVVTISDWGLADRGVELAENGSELGPDTMHEPYGDPLRGQINWEEIRDTLHEMEYSDRSTKVKAGTEVGNIRTFVEEVDRGDVLLAKLPNGIAPCVVQGPTIYDQSAGYTEIANDHVMFRKVKWATAGDNPLTVSPDLLPPGFGTARHTIERVSDPSPMVELLRVVEWIGDALCEEV